MYKKVYYALYHINFKYSQGFLSWVCYIQALPTFFYHHPQNNCIKNTPLPQGIEGIMYRVVL